MSYDFILGEWQENAKESMYINKPLDSIFLFEDKAYEIMDVKPSFYYCL